MHAPDRTYDPIRFHRGTRGFAAFVTWLNGLIVLSAAVFVVPTLALDRLVGTWLVLLGVGAGVAHFVAVVGLIRGRRWAAEIVAYLAAGGIGLAAFGALATATGLDPFGADPRTALGFSLWMIGSWLVATRFAVKPFDFDRPWPTVGRPTVGLA